MLRPCLLATAVLIGPALGSLTGCRSEAEDAPAPITGGAVAAGTPEAARVGREILARGGNAADAAVAVSLALAVSEPGQSGLGGTAVALVRRPGEAPVVIHVPRAAGASEAGGDSIAPPTLLPVLERLWRVHGSGTLEWGELVEPAVRLAEEGFRLGRLSHRTHVREYPRLVADSGLSALFLTENDAIPAEGTLRTRPELAATLRRVARQGPADLYRGELATRLLEWAGRATVPLGREDLSAAAQAREVPALDGDFGGWTVWTAPDPYAGPAVLRALAFLEAAPTGIWSAAPGLSTPWTVEALVWALSAAGDDLGAWMASLPALPVPLEDSAGIRGDRPGTPGATPGGAGGPRPGGGEAPWPAADIRGETTHLSVVDERGGAVALTQTLGGPFGSGVRAADLGFVLGDAGGEGIARVPGSRADETPAATGGDTLPPAEAAEPAGRRWLSPTILTRADSMTLVLGSPGGPRGVSAVVQVVARWVRSPLDLQEAVSAPRIHVGPSPGAHRGRVYLEGLLADPADSVLTRAPEPWSDTVRADVAARGFLVTERDTGLYFQGLSPWFGGVNAVARVGEEWLGAADPRRDGAAAPVSEGFPGAEPEDPEPGGGGAGPPVP